MSRNSCHFRGCANLRADWCKRVDWSEPWPRSATLDSVGKMLVLAAGGWKLFSSSQEGVFDGKTLDVTRAHLPTEPDAAVCLCCARTDLQVKVIIGKLIRVVCVVS